MVSRFMIFPLIRVGCNCYLHSGSKCDGNSITYKKVEPFISTVFLEVGSGLPVSLKLRY